MRKEGGGATGARAESPLQLGRGPWWSRCPAHGGSCAGAGGYTLKEYVACRELLAEAVRRKEWQREAVVD